MFHLKSITGVAFGWVSYLLPEEMQYDMAFARLTCDNA